MPSPYQRSAPLSLVGRTPIADKSLIAHHGICTLNATIDLLRKRIGTWLPPLVGLIFFLIYVENAAPSIVTFFDDSLEFQYVLPTSGIAHPTGYPLYTILGGVWTRLLPLGDWAQRINLLSAFLGGAAVGAVCALAYHLLKIKVDKSLRDDPAWMQTTWQEWTQAPILAAIFAAVAFGFGPTWFKQVTLAEVYALHNLLAALAMLLALLAGRSGGRKQHYLLVGMFLVIGLGLAHHRTIVLVVPGIALYLAWSNPLLLRPRATWWIYGVALLTPLLLYAWLPLRASQGVQDLNAAYVNTWRGFWDHVLARQYTTFLGDNALAVDRDLGDWLRLARDEMGWFVLLLAAWGFFLGLMGRGTVGRASRSESQKAWTMVAVVALCNLLFALVYQVGDVEVFLLPVWMCVALAAGGGADWVVRAAARRSGVALIIWLVFLFVLLWSVDSRGAVIDRSQDWAAHDLAIAMTAPDFPAESTVVGLEGEITAVRYMQDALGQAAGLSRLVADDPDARRAIVDDVVAQGAPLYLTRELPGIEDAYSFSGEGALVRVWERGAAQPGLPTQPQPAGQPNSFARGALQLAGYDMTNLAETGVPTLEVAFYWLPTAPLTQTLKLSLRVIDDTLEGADEGADEVLVLPDGNLAQQDVYPLRLVAPTTTWLPGEVVRDVYQVALPDLADHPGARLQIILYDAETVAEAGRFELPLP